MIPQTSEDYFETMHKDRSTLNLTDLGIENIPKWIDEIDSNLYIIDLSGNKIRHLPYFDLIDKATNIYINGNQLNSIDENYKFPNLRVIDLSNNQLNQLPKPIILAPCLLHLYAKNNQIKSINSTYLTYLIPLIEFKLDGNEVNFNEKLQTYLRIGSIEIKEKMIIEEIEKAFTSPTLVHEREEGIFDIKGYFLRNYERLKNWQSISRRNRKKYGMSSRYTLPYYKLMSNIKKELPENIRLDVIDNRFYFVFKSDEKKLYDYYEKIITAQLKPYIRNK